MLTCGVTLAAVLDLECERDFPPSVFVFLTTDFVLTLGGVFEWIIGVLELIIVSRSISMTFAIFCVCDLLLRWVLAVFSLMFRGSES